MDIDYLLALLAFVKAIKDNDMSIVVGYLNTEALPLLVADPTAVTIGGYENLRMFSLKAFENDDGGVSRGPVARIYVSRLLQWINHQYLGAIRRVMDDMEGYVDESRYRVSMFESRYNWHFAKPEPYKHYFLVFAKQLNRIAAVSLPDRVAVAREECERAVAEYRKLEQLGIVFDPESASGHLGPWITAIKIFEKELGTPG
jgi:hypothetical protein